MQSTPKPRLTEVSPHLICALCGGYLIDATTIVECLHSFCKTCIVRYLESSKYCPICEVLVHKTRPLQNIRLDHTLQDIVYKLVPGLFKDEMNRRREYYKDSPTVRSAEIRQQQQRHRVIFSADEMFSVSLQFSPDGKVHIPVVKRGRKSAKDRLEKRYLLCPAGTTISHLKKFVRLKYCLTEQYQVDLFHAQGNLRDNYSLMDVAYIYSWKRDGVLQLYYSIFKDPVKIPQITITEIKEEPGLKSQDNNSKTYFNQCCDSDFTHDLSPLELIATVANGLSSLPDGREQKEDSANGLMNLQEGRGLKRDTDTAGLDDDDASISNEIQIQKSIQHAIEVCSNNTNDKQSKDEDVNKPSTPNNLAETVKMEKDDTQETNEKKDNIPNKIKPLEIKETVPPEKPKKTDTASQCDPRPRKSENKHMNSNSIHSKTHSKQSKQTKAHTGSDTNSTKTEKDNKTQPLKEKKNKTTFDSAKKLVIHGKESNKTNVMEKVSKSSHHKTEKTASSSNSEKVTQKSDDNKDNTHVQKPSVPQINGICSANELEKEKLSACKSAV